MNPGLIIAAIGAGLIALGFMGKKDDDPRITPPPPSNGTPPPSNGTPPPSNGTPRPGNGTPRPGNGTPTPPGNGSGRPTPPPPPAEHELVSAATAWPEVDIWAEI